MPKKTSREAKVEADEGAAELATAPLVETSSSDDSTGSSVSSREAVAFCEDYTSQEKESRRSVPDETDDDDGGAGISSAVASSDVGASPVPPFERGGSDASSTTAAAAPPVPATSAAARHAAATPPPPRALFHALHYDFMKLQKMLPELRALGFDAVQLPPAQASPPGNLRTQWPLRFKPVRFSVIDPTLGGPHALRRLCAEASRLGVALVADIVLGRCAPVATGAQWLAAQEDPARLEELFLRIDRTFGPELSRHDFIAPWQRRRGSSGALTFAVADDAGLEAEEVSVGDWSYLADTPAVRAAHRSHLAALLGCGVRGFRLRASSAQGGAEQLREYVQFLRTGGATFICAHQQEVSQEVPSVGAADELEHGDAGPPLCGVDFRLAKQLAKAASLGGPCLALPRLASAEAESKISTFPTSAVRFARCLDVERPGGASSASMGAVEARMACAYLLARPEGSVLLSESDANSPAVRRALAFRRGAAQHAAHIFGAGVGSPGMGRSGSIPPPALPAAAAAGLLRPELMAWPPPSYELVLVLLRAPDGVAAGVAALNFGTSASKLHLPCEIARCTLREVLGGATAGAAFWEPRLGAPIAAEEAFEQGLPAREGRFFLLRQQARADGQPPAPPRQLKPEALPGQTLEIFYRTHWPTPHVHLTIAGASVPGPGWPMRPFELSAAAFLGATSPRGGSNPRSGDAGAQWWTVEVPLSATTGSVDFAFNDGCGVWARPADARDYRAERAGTYVVQAGKLRRVEIENYSIE